MSLLDKYGSTGSSTPAAAAAATTPPASGGAAEDEPFPGLPTSTRVNITSASMSSRTRPQPTSVDDLNEVDDDAAYKSDSDASKASGYGLGMDESNHSLGSSSHLRGGSGGFGRGMSRDNSFNWGHLGGEGGEGGGAAPQPPPKGKVRAAKAWLPDRKTLLYRTKVTLRETVTAFWCGSLWQLYGWQFCNKNASARIDDNSSWHYWLATGCGDASGAMLGFVTTQCMRYFIFGDLSLREGAFPVTSLLEGFEVACLLSFGNFCSGFAWQPALGMATISGLDFNEAFGIVWMMCSMSNLLGVTFVRLLFGFACEMEALTPRGNPSTLQRDFSMAMSIGAGAAFFTATDAEEKDNWMGDYFGYDIYSNDSVMFGVFKAGYSVASGFFLFQTLQNMLTSPGECWTDIAGVDVVEDAEGHRVLRLQRFQSQQVQKALSRRRDPMATIREDSDTDLFNLANPFTPLRTHMRMKRDKSADRLLGERDHDSAHF